MKINTPDALTVFMSDGLPGEDPLANWCRENRLDRHGNPYPPESELDELPTLSVMELWNPSLVGEEDEEDTITIFDPIGASFFFEGVTAKRIDAALRSIGSNNPVTVLINSPGGSMFEGLAIYNLLRAHKGKVTVKVIGVAASAASAIAMAGDEIIMNLGAQMMVHNPMSVVLGDFRDLAQASATLKGFRDSVSEIYQSRSGNPESTINKLMNDETFMGGKEAVRRGFATSVDEIKTNENNDAAAASMNARNKALETLNVSLAKDGLTRKERSDLFKNIGVVAPVTNNDDPAAPVTGNSEAWDEMMQALKSLQSTI